MAERNGTLTLGKRLTLITGVSSLILAVGGGTAGGVVWVNSTIQTQIILHERKLTDEIKTIRQDIRDLRGDIQATNHRLDRIIEKGIKIRP